MLEILSVTSPIFILIGVGYICVRTQIISQDTTRGMGVFVITIALPALIIRGMANKPLQSSMDVDFLAGYGLASALLFVVALLFYRRLRRASTAESSMAALGMSSSNSGFIGMAICTMVLGAEPASRAVAMTILVETLMMIPMAMAIADAGQNRSEIDFLGRLRLTLKRLIRSPLVIAICTGLFLSAFRIPVTGVALHALDMLAMAAAPVSLIAVGGNLYGLRPTGLLADAAGISAGKLILHPLLIAVFFLLFPGMDPLMRQAGVIYAAAPMLSMYPILGMRYGMEDRCSATLLVCTLLSFVTISVTIALIV